MTRCLLLVNPADNAIAWVVSLNPNNRLVGETDEQFETRGFARTVQANNWGSYWQHLVDPASLPQDRSKRSAWVWNGSAVVVDPAKEAVIVAAATRCSTDAAECSAAKVDAQLLNLLNMTPAEIAAAIDSAFSDPAQRAVLKRLARVAVVAARRVLR
jgi:hypothetical protein